ncbi:20960_t:CDS:2, partial [Dentiscutata erythropus]
RPAVSREEVEKKSERSEGNPIFGAVDIVKACIVHMSLSYEAACLDMISLSISFLFRNRLLVSNPADCGVGVPLHL